MNSDESAQAFSDLFHQVYQRFYRRVKPGTWQPSREALAVLRHLDRSGPLTVTEAAEHFSRSQAAMSELVSRIEVRGLISRVADERDRRRQLVWLTAAGTDALRAANRPLSQARLAMAFEQMPESDRQATLAVLERLILTTTEDGGWDDE